MAERRGARIMGLGAFTSVVGDAGITVAHESDIAITSGNSLTVSATLEAAKQAVIKMGATDLTKGKVMIIGATGSIGSICSRLLAQAIFDVVLVSIEPERLIDLKRTIQEETPGAKVTIATKADGLLGRMRPHRHRHLCFWPTHRRCQPMQTGCGCLRCGPPTRHQQSRSRFTPRCPRHRKRRSAHSLATSILVITSACHPKPPTLA